MDTKRYKVYRNKGLYLNGELVSHSDLKAEAAEKGITEAELHRILVEKVSNKQLDAQRKLSRREIFKLIRQRLLEGFKVDKYIARNDIPDLLSDEILKVCDEESIAIKPDTYGSFIIPSSDITLADRNVIASLFDSLTDGLDLPYFHISGIDLANTVLRRYHGG